MVSTLAEQFGKVFGGKAFFQKVFTAMTDYGLMAIGLPPTMPSFNVFADMSVDYLVRMGMDEAAKSMGIPLDELPVDVRKEVVKETQKQFQNVMKEQKNPFNVDYLRYATQAQYNLPCVSVEINNNTKGISATGTLYISIKGYTGSTSAFKSESIYIPSLKPGEKLSIPVCLRYGDMQVAAYQKYKNNDPSMGSMSFNAMITYNLPSDIAKEAEKQGVKIPDPNRPVKYVWDKDKYYTYKRDPCVVMQKLYEYQLTDSKK